MNLEKTQDVARETTHKRMREQSEKLTSEIKQNFKSTFKTITETTEYFKQTLCVEQHHTKSY
jgi:hypothetical protein